ncbi:MAG: Bax inhibitor-1/YccA family protein [Alphaproteobacteria bacterium]|nr:Bax inhibitor-1/YccA family protein [Alphaproteobacteria bacterium]
MAFNDPFSTAQMQAQTRATEMDAGLRAYMLRIYNYMASALALTGIVALFAANSEPVLRLLYTTNEMGQMTGMSGLGWLVAFAPLIMILTMSFGVNRMSLVALQATFWGFASVMGLSLSSVFLMYTGESIARVFFITAGTFGGMSLYGYTTKRDLSGFGSFLIMGLIGLILASIVNIFLQSSALNFALSVIGVFIFIGLTAYDTQKLKTMYYQLAGTGEMMAKASIMGALNLYMDFINMFLYMLRFFGDRR